MTRVSICVNLLFAVVFGAAPSLHAQTNSPSASGHVKVIPPPIGIEGIPSGQVKTLPAPGFTPPSLPFAIDAKSNSMRSLRILPENEISREDRDLLADAESSIQERAGIENLEFNGAGWTQDELAEAIMHLIAYAGWPCAIAAMRMLDELFQDEDFE